METGATAVVGRGLVEILPDFKKWGQALAADMRTARAQLDGSAAGLRRSAATVGASMAKIGKGTSALGIGVAAVSVKMAADFQSETAILQTAAGESAKGLQVVREGIKNIAVGTGTGIKNLTDGMYQIEKAGFRGSDGLKVLKAAAQGAREEGAKLSDVTNAMTSIMASYHLKADKSVQVMNAMKTAAGEGKITMEEFSGALSTVLPIASANKIAFEDVAGSVATLTQHGTSAREATHELGATIRALAAPNMVAVREMGRFGLSAQDVSTKLGQRGLSGTANLLVETILHKLGPAGVGLMNAFEGSKQSASAANTMIKNMSGQQQDLAKEYLKGKMIAEDWNSTLKGIPVAQQPALRNFKTLVDRSRGFSRELKSGGPQTKTFTDALKKMSGGAIGLNTILQITGESSAGNAERIKKVGESFHNNSKDVEGWKVTAGLLNVQMDRMKAQVQVLAIDIGTKLIPIVSAVVGYFVQHRGVLLAVAIATGTFIAATAAAYVGMKVYAAGARIAAAATGAYNLAMRLGSRYALGTRIQLAALFVWQKLQATWTGIVTAAQWAWNAAMMANPIGLIIAGILLLVGVVILIATKTQWFQKLWGAIWGFIRKPVLAFVGWLKDNWQLVVWGILTGGIGLAVAWIVRHWDGVKHAFSASIDWVKHNWPLLLAIITGPIGLAVYWVVKHWKMITDGAKAAYHGTVGWFVSLGKSIGAFFSKLPGRISGFFSSLPGKLGGFFSGLWSSISGFFTKLPGKLGSMTIGWEKALLSGGQNLVAGLFHGATTFFTQSVPAFFKTVWSGIVDFFKVVFGIHSPSTVMAGIGVSLIQGLFSGILRVASGITSFISTHIVQPISRFFRSTIPAAAGWMKDRVIGFFRLEYNGLVNIWSGIKSHVLHPIGRFFTSTVPGWAGSLRSRVVSAWNGLRDRLAGVYGSIKARVFTPIGNFFTKTIPGWARTMRDKVKSFFSGMRDGIGSIWSGIRNKTKIPINWVLDHVWNKGIYNVWGKIAGWIGIDNKLKKVKLLAAGGTVGRAQPGMFNRPTAIVGEGNPNYPEYVIPTDPKYATRARGLWEAAGAHFYKDGGILGTIGDVGSKIGGKVKGAVSGITDFLSNPESKARKMLLGALGNITGKLGSSPWVQMAARLPRMAVDGLMKAVKSVGSDLMGAIGLGGGGGGGVQRWSGVVQQALRMVGQPAALLQTTLRRMNQESGGNPKAVNKWDSNWKAGYPSVGLMQVIRPTYQSNAGRFRKTGPFMYGVSINPLANVYASMRYALRAYGSLSRAYNRAGGYELGTAGSSSGWHWTGENGPELMKLPAGTKVRSHRQSMRQAPSAGTTVVHLTVENHGVIGSRTETENWLADSLDQLRRKNRLPRALGGTA